MRVLDPRANSRINRFYHKTANSIGNGGAIGSFLAIGTVAPIGAGVFVDSIFMAGAWIGGAGILGYNRYRSHTRDTVRLAKLSNIKASLPESYHALIEPLIAEVYHCAAAHYKFEMGGQGYQHVWAGYGTRTVYIDRETKAQWEKRKVKEEILDLGGGCEYCGHRINAAQLLLDEYNKAQLEDDTSVQAVLVMVDSQRKNNETMRQIMADQRAMYKELSQ